MFATDDWAQMLPHQPCPGGCGMLEDECACARRAQAAQIDVSAEPVYDAYDFAPMFCAWHKRCTADATDGRYCDVHAGTL